MRVKKEQLIGAVLALLSVASLYVIIVLSVWVIYSGRIYPGVTIAGENLSFKTEAEAVKILETKSEKITELTISGEKVKSSEIGLTFKIQKSVKEAVGLGQTNPFFLGRRENIPVKIEFDQKKLYELLKKSERKQKRVAENPIGKKVAGRIIFSEGKSGKRLNYAQTVANLNQDVGNLGTVSSFAYYEVGPSFDPDGFNQQNMELIPEQLILKTEAKNFSVAEEEILNWLAVPSNGKSFAKVFEGDVIFEPFFSATNSFSMAKIEEHLLELSATINQAPKNALLSASNGQVIVAAPEVDGKKLDVYGSAEEIVSALLKKESEAELVIETQKAEIRSDNLKELGISELVSTGYSNFSGSPVNRIHNVRTGASKFNGMIIKPGAEFSFNTILGPVDASTGYLPELVILENKTQPQFGGGLCQVSSTAFRAALNAGFPILERKAHAYPVSYYKPFGVDATIYLPKPDFRFKNDSKGHILIQTRIVGKNLYFDFYGTKPQRRVSFAAGANAAGAVSIVEKVTPYIYDQGARGARSFSAMFYRFIYDANGKLINSKYFLSKYDSPDKYPH